MKARPIKGKISEMISLKIESRLKKMKLILSELERFQQPWISEIQKLQKINMPSVSLDGAQLECL